MAVNQEKKNKTPLEAATLSPRYIGREIKKVRWTRWKKHGSEQGLAGYLGDTLLFMTFFALFSVLITWLITMGLEAL